MKGRLRIAVVMMVCLVAIVALPSMAMAWSVASQYPVGTVHVQPAQISIDEFGTFGTTGPGRQEGRHLHRRCGPADRHHQGPRQVLGRRPRSRSTASTRLSGRWSRGDAQFPGGAKVTAFAYSEPAPLLWVCTTCQRRVHEHGWFLDQPCDVDVHDRCQQRRDPARSCFSEQPDLHSRATRTSPPITRWVRTV